MTPTPFSSASAPDVMQQEIPNFSERLGPLEGRLRLISECIEYPANQLPRSAEFIFKDRLLIKRIQYNADIIFNLKYSLVSSKGKKLRQTSLFLPNSGIYF